VRVREYGCGSVVGHSANGGAEGPGHNATTA
jgi:hypothetical protein